MKQKAKIKLGLAQPCGAMTKRGTPCQCRMVFDNGRCRLHGGLPEVLPADKAWFQWYKQRALKEIEDYRKSYEARYGPIAEKLKSRMKG